jgi:2-(1,2-epoxy-1,2-dihydrophenyl)acetyl-CoA isomerase
MSDLIETIEDGVATLTFNRPERMNALSTRLALALACDLRIAGVSARLVTAFVRVGFSGDFGGTYFLTRLAGTAKARELYFTGRPVDADEALTLGLVNRVVPDDQLHEATMELARSLAQGPQIALNLMKRNMNCAENASLTELLDIEAMHQVQTGRTEDHREAAKAFVEKRAPNFIGS